MYFPRNITLVVRDKERPVIIKLKISAVLFVLSILSFVLYACTGGDDEGGTIGTGETAPLYGYAQKGPFLIGSTVYILSCSVQDLNNCDAEMVTQTTDSLGAFEFTSKGVRLHDVRIAGDFISELSGKPTSLADSGELYGAILFDEKNRYNFGGVNLLTHLSYYLNWLFRTEGYLPRGSMDHTRDLVVSAFNEYLPNKATIASDFSSLNVYNISALVPEEENAFLLVISATLMQAAINNAKNYPGYDPSNTNVLVGKLASDLGLEVASYGRFSDQSIAMLVEASRQLNPREIEHNLLSVISDPRYASITVPNIDPFLDTDADGVTNNIDNDDDGDGMPDLQDPHPYTFEINLENNQAATVSSAVASTFTLNFNVPEFPYQVIYFTAATHGSISVDPSSNLAKYTPNDPNYTGPDSFDYFVESNNNLFSYASSHATVLLNLTP